MEEKPSGYKNIDEYIALFPGEMQKRLQDLRQAIHAAAPEAVERISYQMPTFYLKGNLVHFAAWRDHIGFYPTPAGIQPFARELRLYEQTKGSIHFPLDELLPLELVKRIVRLRVEQNLKKVAGKSGKRHHHD
jgi:uncharacterized protein YdhG (YjbR/CyaY superfamily)